MLSLSHLVRVTPADKKKASRRVHVASFQAAQDVERGGGGTEAYWSVKFKTTGSQRSHTCEVRFHGSGIREMDPVWVSCDCDDFRYRLEYVLAQIKSASIVTARATRPTKTNPHMKPRLCKHLLKITQIIVQAQEHVARTATIQRPASPR